MAAVDATMGYYLWKYLIPLVGFYVFLRLANKPFGDMYKKGYAYVLDRFAHLFNKQMKNRKKLLFSGLHDMAKTLDRPIRVVEVGAGTGANFKFFPDGTEVVCLDPNPHFAQYLQHNIEQFPHVNLREFVVGHAEDMSAISDNSVDAVVCTLVLCSVDDVTKSLSEIRRIIKKNGRFFYMEHVRANPDSLSYWVQRLIRRPFSVFADGCDVYKDTWRSVDEVGFSRVEQEKFFVPVFRFSSSIAWPAFLRYILVGVATK